MANFVGELAERPLRAHRRKLENLVRARLDTLALALAQIS